MAGGVRGRGLHRARGWGWGACLICVTLRKPGRGWCVMGARASRPAAAVEQNQLCATVQQKNVSGFPGSNRGPRED